MKRVFILGAGSSIGHSEGLFPTINTFFKVAKNNELNINLADEYESVIGYIKKTTGKDALMKATDVDIEAFFTYLEIEIERNPSPELTRIRQKLLGFIQQVLLGLSIKLKSSGGEYLLFADKLKEKEDTVITFNWDLLLDNILERVHILEGLYLEEAEARDALKRQYRNFIFELSAFSENTSKHSTITPPYCVWKPEGGGYYLKMHGSIDWFYCSNTQCRAHLKTFPILEPGKSHSCSECHEPLQCLIIPPVLNKGYRNYPLIRRIWNVAAKELSMAEEIVIWGYSLPPTDFYASWLISQARQAPLKRIKIINPAVFSSKKKKIIGKSFIRRFYNLFRDKLEATSIYLYESYSDFDSNKEIFSKCHLGKKSEVLERI